MCVSASAHVILYIVNQVRYSLCSSHRLCIFKCNVLLCNVFPGTPCKIGVISLPLKKYFCFITFSRSSSFIEDM